MGRNARQVGAAGANSMLMNGRTSDFGLAVCNTRAAGIGFGGTELIIAPQETTINIFQLQQFVRRRTNSRQARPNPTVAGSDESVNYLIIIMDLATKNFHCLA